MPAQLLPAGAHKLPWGTEALEGEDKIFAALRRDVPKPRAREARKNEWISAATWRLVDERVSALRDPAKDQTLIRRLGRAG